MTLLIVAFAVIIGGGDLSQSLKTYPQDYFRAPVDIPMFLAGNFGELRPNHFHAGIDIKTEGREGLPVYASAEGYVSRIKIGWGGYGKALYITHPNGFTTVYGHLKNFSPKIEEYVRKAQYKKRSFSIELFPEASDLKVDKSEVVANSGNTGGSGGPHLHFEIRDTESEVPINPLLFGFDIKDNIPPVLKTLAIYPLEDGSSVSGKGSSKFLPVTGANGRYKVQGTENLSLHGTIGLGLEVIDKLDGTGNRNGVFSIELRMDGKRVYYHEMEKIPFDQSRFINSHMDFHHRKTTRKRIQKSFLDPNNKLIIYKDLFNRGHLPFIDDKLHDLEYIIKDSYGNTSRLAFKLKSVKNAKKPMNTPVKNKVAEFNYDRENFFETEEAKIKIPKGALYQNLDFTYKKTGRAKNGVGPVHHFHHAKVPLHAKATVTLKADAVPKGKEDKAIIVSLTPKGGLLAAEGGVYKDGFMSVKTRSFGPYTIMIDTLKPKITPINISNGKNMIGVKNIQVKITDNLSGIAEFSAYIDGDWVLMEYDRKKKLITHEFESDRLSPGKHEFKVKVKDRRGNESAYKASFTR